MLQKSEENKIYINQIQKAVDLTLNKSSSELKEGVKNMEREMKRRIQAFLNTNTLKPEEIKALITAKAGMRTFYFVYNSHLDYSEILDLKMK